VALYNKPTDGSPVPEIRVSDFSQQDPRSYAKALISNSLLFTSMAFSIIIAMAGLCAKLWLVRYMDQVILPGSPYDRAMRRQEAFGGIKAWRLAMLIDTIPILVFIAVFLFALFV